MTPAELIKIMPLAGQRASLFAQPLTDAMLEFGVTTPKQQAAFLAQVAHESASLRYMLEIASGEAYDTGPLAARLGNTPEDDDDGRRYKGRGPFMITGTDNYRACGTALGLDLLAHPELLEQPVPACRSAGWFWKTHGLNRFADADQYGSLTKAINGGYNGLDDRIVHWLRARKALGL